MALPVKFTARGIYPEVGEAMNDAWSGVITAFTFMIKEPES